MRPRPLPHEAPLVHPHWVQQFVARKFFSNCYHHARSRGGDSQWHSKLCMRCAEVICDVVGQHSSHGEMLQALRLDGCVFTPRETIQRYYNVSAVDRYEMRGQSLVLINPIGPPAPESFSECLYCNRWLARNVDFSVYCSIECQFKHWKDSQAAAGGVRSIRLFGVTMFEAEAELRRRQAAAAAEEEEKFLAKVPGMVVFGDAEVGFFDAVPMLREVLPVHGDDADVEKADTVFAMIEQRDHEAIVEQATCYQVLEDSDGSEVSAEISDAEIEMVEERHEPGRPVMLFIRDPWRMTGNATTEGGVYILKESSDPAPSRSRVEDQVAEDRRAGKAVLESPGNSKACRVPDDSAKSAAAAPSRGVGPSRVADYRRAGKPPLYPARKVADDQRTRKACEAAITPPKPWLELGMPSSTFGLESPRVKAVTTSRTLDCSTKSAAPTSPSRVVDSREGDPASKVADDRRTQRAGKAAMESSDTSSRMPAKSAPSRGEVADFRRPGAAPYREGDPASKVADVRSIQKAGSTVAPGLQSPNNTSWMLDYSTKSSAPSRENSPNKVVDYTGRTPSRGGDPASKVADDPRTRNASKAAITLPELRLELRMPGSTSVKEVENPILKTNTTSRMLDDSTKSAAPALLREDGSSRVVPSREGDPARKVADGRRTQGAGKAAMESPRVKADSTSRIPDDSTKSAAPAPSRGNDLATKAANLKGKRSNRKASQAQLRAAAGNKSLQELASIAELELREMDKEKADNTQ